MVGFATLSATLQKPPGTGESLSAQACGPFRGSKRLLPGGPFELVGLPAAQQVDGRESHRPRLAQQEEQQQMAGRMLTEGCIVCRQVIEQGTRFDEPDLGGD